MSKAINMPQVVELFASTSRGTTTSPVTHLEDNNSVVLQLDVTAKTGTNPTLDVVVYDAPTPDGPWSTLYTFAQLTDAGNAAAAPTRAPMPYIKATGTVGGTATPKFTFTLNCVAFKAASLAINVGSQGGAGAFTGLTVTSADAAAFTVGRLGATTPALKIDASTGSSVTGLQIKSAAAASGVALSVISSGTNENLTIDAKGSGTISLNVTGTGNIVLGRAATGVSLTVTGGILSSGPTGAGIGYATGAGGAVTQATNRSTGVTLNKLTGVITTDTASLAAAAKADFIVTNSTVAATDVIGVSITSGGTGSPRVSVVGVGAGSFTLRVTNDHASVADTSADLINFAVIKAVNA